MEKMTEQISEVDILVSKLNEVQEDITVPRNVRNQLQSIINTLKSDVEMPIKVSKALNGLDEIANDVNLQAYTRTQIWNMISMLEKLHQTT